MLLCVVIACRALSFGMFQGPNLVQSAGSHSWDPPSPKRKELIPSQLGTVGYQKIQLDTQQYQASCTIFEIFGIPRSGGYGRA